MSRKYINTRWDENNCFPQCPECNELFYGRPQVYESILRNRLGDVEFERMVKRARKNTKLSEADIDALIEKYKALLKAME